MPRPVATGERPKSQASPHSPTTPPLRLQPDPHGFKCQRAAYYVPRILAATRDVLSCVPLPRDPYRLAPAIAASLGVEAAARTSLDTVETSVQVLSERFSVGPETPHGIRASQLAEFAVYDSQRTRAEEVRTCGTFLWVALDQDGVCVLRNRCKHRYCLSCQRYRAKCLSAIFKQRITDMRHPLMLTLTLKAQPGVLRDTVNRLTKAFHTLRRREVWKSSCAGGWYVVEITRAPDRSHFHVHLHAILESSYIPQAWISDTWHKITGDSVIVHIRKAGSRDAHYLASYVGKSLEPDLEPWEIWPFHNEISGLRLVHAFGNQPSINEHPDEPTHTLIAPLRDIYSLAAGGDTLAQWVLDELALRYGPRDKVERDDAYQRRGLSPPVRSK